MACALTAINADAGPRDDAARKTWWNGGAWHIKQLQY
jgi:hypothetical protein